MGKGLRCGLPLLRTACLWHSGLGLRGLATTVDKALLSKLRKRTGISFINCKKALEQFENDLEKAEKWLKEQAQKEGWAKATKLQSRAMSNGLVAIVCNNQAATMIEMNCETDFVARNNKFINLTTSLAHDCHNALLQQSSEPQVVLDRSVGSMVAGEGRTLADRVALEVGSIGENMALRRAVHVKGGLAILSAYVHASGPEIKTDSDCRLGKYGVVISLDRQTPQAREGEEVIPLDELSHALGQHIVGMSPKLVGDLEAEESDGTDSKEEEKKEEEKEEEEEKKEEKEEARLVFQEFLLDPSQSVGELLRNNGVVVNTFYRFACGEELPQDEKDS